MNEQRLRNLPSLRPELAGFSYWGFIDPRYQSGFVVAEAPSPRMRHWVSIRLFDETSELAVVEIRRAGVLPADFVHVTPCGQDLDLAIQTANEIQASIEAQKLPRHKEHFDFMRAQLENSLISHYGYRAEQDATRARGVAAAAERGFNISL